MLVVPALFAVTFWCLLSIPSTVHRVKILSAKSWIVPRNKIEPRRSSRISTMSTEPVHTISEPSSSRGAWDEEIEIKRPIDSASESSSSDIQEHQHVTQKHLTMPEKFKLILPMLKYMIPLALVYFAEYLINQGLTELIVFDCASSFHMSRHSQYRWYQVLYQVGVFISRSSVNIWALPKLLLFLLPVLQLSCAFFFAFEAIYLFLPHIWIVFIIIVFEGLLGGACYVNTYYHVHREVAPDVREYSISITSCADSIGIMASGFLAVALHNYICAQQKYHL
uniref:Battenin n=1 Tax=Panagrellus redivivus TaxID=6233 RepID=A0A7E4UPT7_PANRE